MSSHPATTEKATALARAAVDEIGLPCAVAGATLAGLRGWVDLAGPDRAELVIPVTRRNVRSSVATLRRVQKWSSLEIVPGPYALPCLGALDGVVTLAPACDDATLHTVVQRLAHTRQLDVGALARRRRTGLPGSARITRVCSRYLLGLDSPREVEVYDAMRRAGIAPDHLNVFVVASDGRTVGPFDGYSDVGAAYEVDSVFHLTAEQQASDSRKSATARAMGVEVVRFIGSEITERRPMLEGWFAALDAARLRGAGVGLDVVHQPGRSCVCGHAPEAA